jgi:hypothetical protein
LHFAALMDSRDGRHGRAVVLTEVRNGLSFMLMVSSFGPQRLIDPVRFVVVDVDAEEGLERERRERGLVRVGHFELGEGCEAGEVRQRSGEGVVEKDELGKVFELTDGRWDGPEVVVLEDQASQFC